MLRTCFPQSASTFLLSATLALSACGNIAGPVSKKNAVTASLTSTGSSPTQISGYYPASGTYAAVPSTVQVNFTTGGLDAATASSVNSYTIACGGTPYAAQSVAFASNVNSVSVSLPSITGLANGTVCTFTVALSLRDANGDYVTGEHTVNYLINSGATTGATWNEAATAVYTSAIGTASGSTFQSTGATGVVLTGLNVNYGTYVLGISGLWANGFSSTTTATGPVHGAGGSGVQLACPAGYRMTGVYGNSGAYVDSIGITCKTQDQTQTYNSSVVGGTGGSSYNLSCPAGMFATDLYGYANGNLQQLYLGCR